MEELDFIALACYELAKGKYKKVSRDGVVTWKGGVVPVDQSVLEAKAKVLKDEYNKNLVVTKFKAERQELLDNGMTTEDALFWFNEKWATVFMTKVLSAEFVGLPAVKWKDAKGVVVDVPLDKAKVYIKEMIVALDKVYLG